MTSGSGQPPLCRSILGAALSAPSPQLGSQRERRAEVARDVRLAPLLRHQDEDLSSIDTRFAANAAGAAAMLNASVSSMMSA